MIRCDFISCLPYVPGCDGPVPYAKETGWIKTPCRKDVVVVRYENGIIVEGYCETHCDTKRLSLHPWPGSAWERYSEAKHYGVAGGFRTS